MIRIDLIIIIYLFNLIRNMLKKFNLNQIIQQRLFSKKIEKRNPKYSVLNERDLNFFEKTLNKSQCISDSQLLDTYNTDWLRIVKGVHSFIMNI